MTSRVDSRPGRKLILATRRMGKTRYYLAMITRDEEHSEEESRYFYQVGDRKIAKKLVRLFNRKLGPRYTRESQAEEEEPELPDDAPGGSAQITGSALFYEVRFEAQPCDKFSEEDQFLIEEKIGKVAGSGRFWDEMSSPYLPRNYHDGSENELSSVNLYHQARKWEKALIRKEQGPKDEPTTRSDVQFPLIVHIRKKRKPKAIAQGSKTSSGDDDRGKEAKTYRLFLDTRRHLAMYKGHRFSPARQPFDLLVMLAREAMESPGFVTRDAIYQKLWEEVAEGDRYVYERQINDTVRELRNSFKPLVKAGAITREEVKNLIEAKRKVGFRLTIPASEIKIL